MRLASQPLCLRGETRFDSGTRRKHVSTSHSSSRLRTLLSQCSNAGSTPACDATSLPGDPAALLRTRLAVARLHPETPGPCPRIGRRCSERRATQFDSARGRYRSELKQHGGLQNRTHAERYRTDLRLGGWTQKAAVLPCKQDDSERYRASPRISRVRRRASALGMGCPRVRVPARALRE